MCEHTIYIHGIGHLDQYGSYMKTLWSKNVVYFIRDYFEHEIKMRSERGAPVNELRPLIKRYNQLNSDIRAREHGTDNAGRHLE